VAGVRATRGVSDESPGQTVVPLGLTGVTMGAAHSAWSRSGCVHIRVPARKQTQGYCAHTAAWQSLRVDVTNSSSGCPASGVQICLFWRWDYSPGTYPTGDGFLLPTDSCEGYVTPNPGDIGGFVSSTITNDIQGTIHGSGSMSTYDTDVTTQQPLLFQPVGVQPVEVSHDVTGTTTVNPVGSFAPEYMSCPSGWRY
jgi:hypothetical protein